MSYYSDLSADDSSVGDEDDEEEEMENESDIILPKSSNSKAIKTRSSSVSAASSKDGGKQDYAHHQSSSSSSSAVFPPPLDHNCSSSIVLHLDIDCFYCQCEHLDRKLPNSQPLAIGQKHIIVTSNYAARKLGVKKLQGREDARRACPGLLIVEGSDLERYRRHGRKVYDVFRECIRSAFQVPPPEDDKKKTTRPILPAVRRGRGMDEMQADLSILVDELERRRTTHQQSASSSSPSSSSSCNTTRNEQQSIYIYGEQKETTTLTEDQTGQEVVVGPYDASFDEDDDKQSSINTTTGSSGTSTTYRSQCEQRLLLAAQKLAPIIQQTILQRTGFTATLGISINPLLAKLASDLQKPQGINVLYPWRTARLIAPMPLRKIPDAGYKTIKLLKPALERFHGEVRDSSRNTTNGTPAFWTCGDLLRLPKSQVRQCLNNNEQQCTMILQRCLGIDTTTIVDDGGEAPKTISCENSFKRGTVVTPEAVWKGMEELYVRLPRLLKDRREWSQQPTKAYPTTIRLTARVVDGSNLRPSKGATGQQHWQRRRPYVTRSKQTPFRGQELMQETNDKRQARLVKEAVQPLVQSLVLHSPDPICGLNVTRLNIAVTNFQDVSDMSTTTTKREKSSPLLTAFASQSQFSQQNTAAACCTQQQVQSKPMSAAISSSSQPLSSISSAKRPKVIQSTTTSAHESSNNKRKQRSTQQQPAIITSSCRRQAVKSTPNTNLPSGVDPATLAELPPDMVQQIVQDYKDVIRKNNTTKALHGKPTKVARIDQFFKRK